MNTSRSATKRTGSLFERVGTVLVLLLPLLSVLQIAAGLKSGKVVSPYSHGWVVFTRHDSAGGFWTVIALYAAVAVVTAMLSVHILRALWKRVKH
jgi:hypothetical protein